MQQRSISVVHLNIQVYIRGQEKYHILPPLLPNLPAVSGETEVEQIVSLYSTPYKPETVHLTNRHRTEVYSRYRDVSWHRDDPCMLRKITPEVYPLVGRLTRTGVDCILNDRATDMTERPTGVVGAIASTKTTPV